ncbi:MAG: hypothetical protein LBO74_04660 [Candidatus Symbiothrix sp.]|nr:hypothetical protein [Candidatus Symbiothrix sp.]
MAAIFVQNAGKDTLYYVHTDYQGSLIALSLPDGTVVERYAYELLYKHNAETYPYHRPVRQNRPVK